MREHNVLLWFILSFVTFGIAGIVWLVRTKTDMNNLGANIPTAILLIIPIVNLYWFWTWCMGVEKVTNKAIGAPVLLILCILFGPIGIAVGQTYLNKVATAA